jgi:ACS family hexuronate transporter-like MFS transporter
VIKEGAGVLPVKFRTLPALRWWVGGLLFASTVINYLDRQTLSVLAPYLKQDYRWSNGDYALIVIAYRVAYSIGQAVSGRLIDRVGTRRGLTISVIGYSVAAILTSLATGLRSFAFFRFLLGAGESANWPGATKAVSEWFPKRERAWAVALFDSGSSIGGAIAPALVVWLYLLFHSWRPVFIITGLLGFLWLIPWRWLYHPPESHPRISDAERNMIIKDKLESEPIVSADPSGFRPPHSRWGRLISLPQTWGVIAARGLTDPVWFFITDWFAIYLLAKGFKPEDALLAFWIPFVAADLGNFFGGGVSSWLVKRGWPIGWARKAVIIFGGIGTSMLIPTLFTSNLYAIAGLFAVSTFSYSSFSTMAIVLPSDLYKSEAVASVSGVSGMAAGLLTIISTFLIGRISDRFSFKPILITASLIPLVGVALVLLLVRNTKSTEQGWVRRI